jgi:hypothetical protein
LAIFGEYTKYVRNSQELKNIGLVKPFDDATQFESSSTSFTPTRDIIVVVSLTIDLVAIDLACASWPHDTTLDAAIII